MSESILWKYSRDALVNTMTPLEETKRLNLTFGDEKNLWNISVHRMILDI